MSIRLPCFLTASLLLVLVTVAGCQTGDSDDREVENWKLGWRMLDSATSDEELARRQYDSLRRRSPIAEWQPVVAQLAIILHLSTRDSAEIAAIAGQRSPEERRELCQMGLLVGIVDCPPAAPESVTLPAWRDRLVGHHVRDQAVRGQLPADLIAAYAVDTTGWQDWDAAHVDSAGRALLQEFIITYGFPTRAQVGEEGMQSVFLIAQHADTDREWQAAQLPHLERAVARGDLDPQDYAYLFDRVRVGAGKQQRYGTQFRRVDAAAGVAELFPVEDSLHLDRRRMEMGMMPAKLYVRTMLEPG
ncbi:DUF6624 domain-containing protein [Lewinella sp. IMCC34183]|uniref:DUF6624 domain-containing protein n=1 Tax=Lewinella sp. IMCC34183 TaxID=2248762 RepID=UPI000E24F3E4|nr:DUF6624 domain-containing protein [Lewinella sp. IMCC34183]